MNAKTKPFLGWFDIYVGNRVYRQNDTDFLTDTPVGVELEVREAEKSKPVFLAERPWEELSLSYPQVKKQDGKFAMWYSTAGPELSSICYAESRDGFDWERPDLGLIEFGGSTRNNICMTGTLAGLPAVFEDPAAPPSERFKTISMHGRWEDAEGNPLSDAEGERRSREELHVEADLSCRMALWGGTSPDGLRWTPLEDPLFEYFCDTHNLAYYDKELEAYVAYVRTHGPHGRSIGRVVAKEFKNWPQPEVVCHADPHDPPHVDLYSSCYCRYPGCEDLHLMFPSVYDHITNHVDVQFAVSVNGVTWTRPLRRPVIPCGPAGSGEEGQIHAGPDLVLLDERRMGLMYQASPGLHSGPVDDAPAKTHYAWAIWPKDRLMGIRARYEGGFTLICRFPCGEPVRLNYCCETGGWVKVELVSRIPYPPAEMKGIEGFTFEDCELLTGDEPDRVVHWNGSADVSRLAGVETHLRFRLFRATVFAVTI